MDKKQLEKMTKKELVDLIIDLNQTRKGTNIPLAHTAKIVKAEEIYKDRIVLPSSKDKRNSVKLNKERGQW